MALWSPLTFRNIIVKVVLLMARLAWPVAGELLGVYSLVPLSATWQLLSMGAVVVEVCVVLGVVVELLGVLDNEVVGVGSGQTKARISPFGRF